MISEFFGGLFKGIGISIILFPFLFFIILPAIFKNSSSLLLGGLGFLTLIIPCIIVGGVFIILGTLLKSRTTVVIEKPETEVLKEKPAVEMVKVIICPNCDMENESSANFCKNCGYKLKKQKNKVKNKK